MSGPVVHQGDALEWLEGHGWKAGAIATSPPDASELGLEPLTYVTWLQGALDLIFEASSGPTVLVLTDRKYRGTLLSKAAMAIDSGERARCPLLWHRIALRRPLGSRDLYVPTYSHVLAFGPGRPGEAQPDVLEEGERLWAHGVGLRLAAMIAAWLQEVGAERLVDPFCGTGALLRAALDVGLEAWGCELDEGRARQALDRLGEP